MTQEGRLKVAVVGAQHPHVFPRLDLLTGMFAGECEVTGLYDGDAAVREHVSRTYGVAVHDDPGDALASRPDVVIVNGLDSENPALVRAVVPGPKAVLLEKVGAPTVEEMRAVVEHCAGHRVHVTVGFILHHSPVVPKLGEIVASGVLGPVTLARFHAATPVGCSAEIWQSIPEDLGGMVFTDGIHMVREIIELLGVPDGVTGRIRKLRASEAVESDIYKADVLAGLGTTQEFRIGELRHEDAGVVVMDYPEHLAVLDMTGWEAHNWVERWRLELYGANATLEAGLMPPFYRLSVRRPGGGYAAGTYEQSYSDGTSSGAAISLVPDITYQNEMRSLLDAARAGSTDQSELRAALQCVEILGAAFEASGAFEGVGVPVVDGWKR